MTTPDAHPALDPGSTRRLLRLSASAFVVLAAEPLYLVVDTAVVGHLGRVSLGGLGIGAALMGLLTVVGTFVEYGTTSRAARWFGAGRVEQAVGEGVQASWLAFGIGVVVVVLGEVVAEPLTMLLAGGAGPTQQAAESWLRIAIVGLPGILLVLAGNGWMRGVQRTREPVVLVLVANVISAVLSPVLVYPLGLGLEGSAWANLAAQVVGGALFLRSLRRQVAFLTAAAVASRMGSAQIAAHQIGLQLWELTALLLDSFAIAAQSLVGAALGGSDADGARRMAWQVARWGLYAGVGFAAAYAAGWVVVPRIFTSDDGVLHQAHVLWPWFVAMLPAAGLVFALDGVLIGAGDVGFLAWLTVVSAVAVFAPLNLAALHWGWGLGGVWAGLAAFVVVRLAGTVLRTRGSRWLVLGESR